MRRPHLLLVLPASLLLAGCGSGSDRAPEAGASSTSSGATPSSTTSSAPSTSASASPGAPPSPANPRVGQVVHGTVTEKRGTTTVDVTLTKVDVQARSDFQDFRGRPVLLFHYTATNTGTTTLTGPDPISYRFGTLTTSGKAAQMRAYYAGSASSPDGCQTAPDGPWAPGRTIRGCSVNVLPTGTTYKNFAFLSGDMTNPAAAIYHRP